MRRRSARFAGPAVDELTVASRPELLRWPNVAASRATISGGCGRGRRTSPSVLALATRCTPPRRLRNAG